MEQSLNVPAKHINLFVSFFYPNHNTWLKGEHISTTIVCPFV